MENGWKWLCCIQPMWSKPGHSWQGPFFLFLQPLFVKNAFLDVFETSAS